MTEGGFSQGGVYKASEPVPQRAWQPLLDERLSGRVQQSALIIAERMGSPDFVHTHVEQIKQHYPFAIEWTPTSLASGDVGVALMYEYIDRCLPRQDCRILTQQYLKIAAQGTQQSTLLHPSLFGGACGLALVLSLASREGKYYQKTLAKLQRGLCEQVLLCSWKRPETDGGVADSDYDIISGASGILAYLVSIEQPDTAVQAACEHVLAYLTWLAEPGQARGKERWFVPPALLPTNEHRKATPHGHFNCGLAHGIPGPLAALALTWLAGYRYPGLRESIVYLADWVSEHRVDTPWGCAWPATIPLERASHPQDWSVTAPEQPASWCYGTPGISRSLWLAGRALDDNNLQQIAIEALEATLCRPVSEYYLRSPHLCHGMAGFLQVCLRFAQECDSKLVREKIPVLVEHILDAFNPDFAFGFQDLDGRVPLDNPTWLTGTPGIVMTLLAASTPIIPAWDRILAIA